MKFSSIALAAALGANGLSGPAAAATGTCSKVVYCLRGQAHLGSYQNATGKTCADECGSHCCVGNRACNHGQSQFRVCADEGDGSCAGEGACHGIRKPFDENEVGLISGGSCVGDWACAGVAYDHRSIVGNISNGSCVGTSACHDVGREAGVVGNITDSCQGDYACYHLARKNPAFQSSLNSCCNTDDKCRSFGCKYGGCTTPPLPPAQVPATCSVEPPPTPSPTTGSPTGTPTASPTSPGPWTVSYVGANANFTSGAPNEFEVGFYVGVGREVNITVLNTCNKEATLVPSSMYNKTLSHKPIGPNASNLTHSKIVVGYTFDKAEMVNSTLWNITTNEFSFCQVTKLTIAPDGIGEAWVIAEDRREIDIKFDLNANFDVNVNLAKGTVANVNETVNFEDDVDAYKCTGGSANSFDRDTTLLSPNTELAVCVKSENDAVNIADVTDMDIKQDAAPVGVIGNNGKALIPAITSKQNVPQQGTIVKTRVPLDKFTFETDKNITITGTVKLELDGTAGTRKLRALADEDGLAEAGTEEAVFAVSVNLQSEADGFAPIGSSGGQAIVDNGLVVFCLAVVAAIALVM